MGDPKFARKHYATPSHPWDGVRISEENQILRKYGLKNKRELWKIQTTLRDLRHQARELQARIRSDDSQAIMERANLLDRLGRRGLLGGKAELTDVLALEVEALLSRRLQTQIYMKGLARTIKQARQLIIHGHIAIAGRKVTVPSYMVTDSETPLIDYYHSSPMVSDMHPERPAADFQPEMTTVKEERQLSSERERDMRRQRELDRIAAMKQAIKAHQDAESDEDPDAVALDAEGNPLDNPVVDDEKPPEAEGGKDAPPAEGESKPAPAAKGADDKATKGGDS